MVAELRQLKPRSRVYTALASPLFEDGTVGERIATCEGPTVTEAVVRLAVRVNNWLPGARAEDPTVAGVDVTITWTDEPEEVAA